MHKAIVEFPSSRWIAAGILASCSPTVLASGFALIEQSASQMGNAFAGGSAYANDASTIYFNPAGMTRLPAQFVGGLHAVKTTADFSGTASDIFSNPVSGGDGGDAGGWGIIPNLYITAPLGNGLFAGLGINAPFGLSTEYDNDWQGRYQAIESEVRTINFNPAIAYRINNRLSVGAGISIQYIDAKLTQAIDQGSLCAPTLSSLQSLGVPGADPANCAGLVPQGADGFTEVEGDNWGGGYNLGILYEPTANTRLGLAYRSKISQQLTGKAKFDNTIPQLSAFGIFVRTDVRADVDLPQTASVSIWHDLNSKWSVMADATWTGWDNFDELRIQYDSNQPDTVVDENWKDTWRYSIGADYRLNSAWTLRAGAAFDESPIPDAQHRTARIPGEDRTWISFGVGYKINSALAIDIGYAHLFVDDPKINETSSGGTLNGEYDADVNIISAQVVWNI